MVTVYTLNRDVDSGEEVSVEDFTTTSVNKNTAPKDYLTPADLKEKNITKIAMTAGTVLSKEMILQFQLTYQKQKHCWLVMQ